MKLFAALSLLATVSHCAATRSAHISPNFQDKTYRIERSFVPADKAKSLLHKIVRDGTPTDEENFDQDTVKVIGDGGDRHVPQHDVKDFASALRAFATSQYHENTPDNKKESLVYYMEQLEAGPRERTENYINQVVDNSVMDDGGTIHLYMSSPGVAALDNHTDTTDIVVVQLDGEKEWLLCKEPANLDTEVVPLKNAGGLRKADDFSTKLDSCSTYSEFEIDDLDCERTILYPGDALFLPRRIVHSARALPHGFSAHLTFGFNEDNMCRDYNVAASSRRLVRTCDSWSCNRSCDGFCNRSCDKGWPKKIFSCDSGCKTGCDDSCDICFDLPIDLPDIPDPLNI